MSVNLQAIPVVYFEESGVKIAHCVPLDVSSCGHDLDEARRNIRDAVSGFFEACEEIGSLEEVLEKAYITANRATGDVSDTIARDDRP